MGGGLKELHQLHASLREGLLIDRNRLDEELEKQAEAFYEVCEAHAQAVSLRDELKTGTEEQYAISATKIRAEFEKGGERHTEAQVKEAVSMDKEYLDSCASYLDAKKLSDLLAGLRDAYDQRGKMLKELAQLYLGGYFTTTRIEGSASSIKEGAANAARAAMSEGRKPLAKFGKKG